MTTLSALRPAILSLAFGASLFASPIVIFNTGQSAGGSALAVGTADTHYSLVSAPAGVGLSALATSPNGAWTGNTASSTWISPGSSGGTGWPVGDYDYRTTFDLTGLNAATAQLSGFWAADNNACILLNGLSTGSANCVGFAVFGNLSTFSISSGFLSGVNTLDFIVTNGGGPTGLMVEISGAAAPVGTPGVPEPSTFLLLGASLLCFGISRARR